MLTRVLIITAFSVLIIAAGRWMMHNLGRSARSSTRPFAAARFACEDGKAIEAKFYAGRSKPSAVPGEPPSPGGRVRLALSDGRSLDLSQTVSADGARYASIGEARVFWTKGHGAFLIEHGVRTYTGCIAAVPDPGGLPRVYENGDRGFLIRYPADYSVDTDYRYEGLGGGASIAGVKFTVAPSTAAGTNLASDTYLAVEAIPYAPTCTAERFVPAGSGRPQTVAESGTTYSVAHSSGAAAGNRYEDTVYALPGTSPCLALRYRIHYGVLENFPDGTVQPFDRQALLERFDEMRRTLVVQQ